MTSILALETGRGATRTDGRAASARVGERDRVVPTHTHTVPPTVEPDMVEYAS